MSKMFHLSGEFGVMLITDNYPYYRTAAQYPMASTVLPNLQFHSDLPYLQFVDSVPSTPTSVTFAGLSTQTISKYVDDSGCSC